MHWLFYKDIKYIRNLFNFLRFLYFCFMLNIHHNKPYNSNHITK